MIISASRRTDIPAFFAPWFARRLKEGFVVVRNPYNARQLSRISLQPDVVDGFVLWTKNPTPLKDYMTLLDPYAWYVQYTLNPYGVQIESAVPDEAQRIASFKELSSSYGKDRLVWRYDPIFFSDLHTVPWHEENFKRLAGTLSGFTDTCNTSFMHMYAKTKRNTAGLGLRPGNQEEQLELLDKWDRIGRDNGIKLYLCATPEIQTLSGVPAPCCIDANRLSRIGGMNLAYKKDPTQRPDCKCAASIDIGAYDSCVHGCVYCYANGTQRGAVRGLAQHDPHSPILLGQIGEDETVKERVIRSMARGPLQLRLPGV